MATNRGRVRSAAAPGPMAAEAAGAVAVGPQVPGGFTAQQMEQLMGMFRTVTGVQPQQVQAAAAQQMIAASKHTLPVSLNAMRDAYKSAPDVVERAKLVSFVRDTLRRPDWADDLEGKPWAPGMWSSTKLSAAQSPTWQQIGLIAVGAFGILLVYDAMALWFDLPRIGILPRGGGAGRGR